MHITARRFFGEEAAEFKVFDELAAAIRDFRFGQVLFHETSAEGRPLLSQAYHAAALEVAY